MVESVVVARPQAGLKELADEEMARGLSAGQRCALEMALSGATMFLTGCAGTGKSFLLRRIVAALRGQRRRTIVTAPTALAACALGGVTLQSFAGVGRGDGAAEKIRSSLSGAARERWSGTDVLVIDEVSMVSAGLLERVDVAARAARSSERPFGGVQILFAGDFFQLPPVFRSDPSSGDGAGAGAGPDGRMCFQSQRWKDVVGGNVVVLKEVFRQRDAEFVRALNDLRVGDSKSARVAALVKEAAEREPPRDAVHLFSHNEPAERVNRTQLARLPGGAIEYTARDTGSRDSLVTQLQHGCLAPASLMLKVGAQVLLLANLDRKRGLVNGMRGVVVGFEWRQSDAKWKRQASKNKFVERPSSTSSPTSTAPSAPPLPSSSSSSSPRGTEEDVAATLVLRKRSADSPSAASGEQEPPPIPFDVPPIPVVRFEFPDGTKRDEPIDKHAFRVEDPVDPQRLFAERVQVPLRLAWAISVHKSQGMTLPRMCAHLEGTFECGQAYVALSRASSRAGLAIRNFDPQQARARGDVLAFYNSIDPDPRSSLLSPTMLPPEGGAEDGGGGDVDGKGAVAAPVDSRLAVPTTRHRSSLLSQDPLAPGGGADDVVDGPRAQPSAAPPLAPSKPRATTTTTPARSQPPIAHKPESKPSPATVRARALATWGQAQPRNWSGQHHGGSNHAAPSSSHTTTKALALAIIQRRKEAGPGAVAAGHKRERDPRTADALELLLDPAKRRAIVSHGGEQ